MKLIVLLNFAFKCSLINETSTIAPLQTGTQTNQLTSPIYRTGNITNFTKNHASKSFFLSQDSKEMCSLIFVSAIKKGVSGKHSVSKKDTYYVCFH